MLAYVKQQGYLAQQQQLDCQVLLKANYCPRIAAVPWP